MSSHELSIRVILVLVKVLAAIFIFTCALTQIANRKTMDWRKNPVSAYLAGVPFSDVQDVGFLALSVATALLAVIGTSMPIIVSFSITTIALCIIVITKLIQISEVVGKTGRDRSSSNYAELERLHKNAAAVAFIAATFGLGWTGYFMHQQVVFVAAILCPITAFLFMRLAPEQSPIEERACIGLILIAMFAMSG